jgi:SAM-dependent methyltransferase
MEDVACIFCGIGNHPVLIEQEGYFGRRCPQCGLIYLSPRPSRNEIADLYGHDLAHTGARSHISAEYEKRLFARHHLRLIKKFVRGRGKILEIGAGAGFFLDEARKAGFEPFALEINPVYTGYLQDVIKIAVENKTLSAASFPDEEFDVIYHCDVISHFYDPLSEFNEMNRKLKMGGLLVFETGNLVDVDERFYPYYPSFQFPDHLYFFGRENIKELMRRTGFEIVKEYRYSILPQIRFRRLLMRIAALLKKEKDRVPEVEEEKWDPSGEQNQSQPGQAGVIGKPLRLPRFLNDCMGLLNYFLRYQLGFLLAKSNRPQSVIVIARKI